MRTESSKTIVSPAAGGVILGLSAAACILALFQWVELLIVRSGGTAICSINETFSCTRVWDSAFASRIHDWTGVPVAGWGLVWGITCLGLSLRFIGGSPRRDGAGSAAAGLKWAALAGVFASVGFALASFRAGAICVTCLGTYALALLFAGVVWSRIPGPVVPSGSAGRDGLLWSGGLVVLGFLLVLYPGMRTPHASGSGVHYVAKVSLAEFVARLSSAEQQFLSNAANEYRQQTKTESQHPIRRQDGPDTALIRLVEFTDILCPHCRHFGEALTEMRRAFPPETFSIEPRQYPLDAACNPHVPRSSEQGPVRCLAAKVLICLESTSDFGTVSEALFSNQEQLTEEGVWELATQGTMKRDALKVCVERKETLEKLFDDVSYAQELDIQGTPMVTVNGKKAIAAPLFIYALSLAKGDVEAFRDVGLPKPQPRPTLPPNPSP